MDLGRRWEWAVASVECDHIVVTHTSAAKNIQRRADSQIDFSLAQLCHRFQVCERIGSARVRGWQRRPLCQLRNKLLVDAAAEPFDIHRMDQKFRAPGGK